MTETITRRQVRHPKDFGDRELFKRAFIHWIPSECIGYEPLRMGACSFFAGGGRIDEVVRAGND